MDTTMAWLSQGNLHCLAALEAPSHSLEFMGWEKLIFIRQEESSGSGSGLGGKFVVVPVTQSQKKGISFIPSLTIMR